MIPRLIIMHENARSALECGGSTPPYIKLKREGQGGVEPPHSKVPSAQSFSWQRAIPLWSEHRMIFLASLGMTGNFQRSEQSRS